MTVATARARKARPKLCDISLDRDIYFETVAAMGFDPLPAERHVWDAGFIQLAGWLALDAPIRVESARAQRALPQIAAS